MYFVYNDTDNFHNVDRLGITNEWNILILHSPPPHQHEIKVFTQLNDLPNTKFASLNTVQILLIPITELLEEGYSNYAMNWYMFLW